MRATYTRLYTDEQGIARFEEVGVDLIPGFATPPADPLHVARFVAAERCYRLGAPADWQGDAPYPTPRRQILVTVQGEYEIIAGDGMKRRFPVGSTLLVEDTTGSGHSTKITSAGEALVFAVGRPQIVVDAILVINEMSGTKSVNPLEQAIHLIAYDDCRTKALTGLRAKFAEVCSHPKPCRVL